MRRPLLRAGWALSTVGALSVATPLLAQTSPTTRPSNSFTRVAAPAADKSALVMDDAAGKREEMQLELALLSDPVTFQLGLCCRCQGNVVDVTGCVPSEAMRQKALQAVHAHTNCQIRDSLQIQPNMAMRYPADSVDDLQLAAASALARVLGARANDVVVTAQAGGCVTVTGNAATLEQKLAVSKCLRRVEGCTCAVNQMNVGAAGGIQTTQYAPMPVATPRPEPTPALAPAPAPIAPTITRSEPAMMPAPPPQMQSVTRPQPMPRAEVAPRVQTLSRPEPMPRVQAPSRSEPMPVSLGGHTPAWSEPTVSKSAAAGDAYVTTGVVTFSGLEPMPVKENKITPATLSTPAVSPVRTPAVAVKSQPVKPTLAATKPSTASLKKSIETACGAQAKNVQVTPVSDKKLEVRLTVHNEASGNELAQKVFALPELAPYEVSMKVDIAK